MKASCVYARACEQSGQRARATAEKGDDFKREMRGKGVERCEGNQETSRPPLIGRRSEGERGRRWEGQEGREASI